MSLSSSNISSTCSHAILVAMKVCNGIYGCSKRNFSRVSPLPMWWHLVISFSGDTWKPLSINIGHSNWWIEKFYLSWMSETMTCHRTSEWGFRNELLVRARIFVYVPNLSDHSAGLYTYKTCWALLQKPRWTFPNGFLQWTSTYEYTSLGRQAKTYSSALCKHWMMSRGPTKVDGQ